MEWPSTWQREHWNAESRGDPLNLCREQSWWCGRKSWTYLTYGKATGDMALETELPAGTTGGSMTYRHDGRQYIVVAVRGRDEIPE